MKLHPETFFWTGAGLLLLAACWLAYGGPPHVTVLSLMDVSLGADGRCTGFPSSLGRWDWSTCCAAHDLGGSDGALASCLLDHTPMAATPLVFLACALMAFGRPLYNQLQRWGWAK